MILIIKSNLFSEDIGASFSSLSAKLYGTLLPGEKFHC